MKLTIAAQVLAEEGQADAVEAALRDLIPITRGEQGCEAYQLHRSIEDRNLFHLHEIWTTKAEWEVHMQAPHIQAFGARTAGMVANWTLYQLERLD